MADHHRHWRAKHGIALLSAVLIFPLTATAAPTTIGQDSTVQLALDRARSAEFRGNWAEALQLYEEILTANRDHAQARKGFLLCLRQCHRKYRIADPSFTAPLLNPQLKLSDVQEFYKDLLRKVNELYVHGHKAQLNLLFQAGVEELLFDLDDPDFIAKFLKPKISLADVQEFRNQLRARWANININSLAEAVEQVRNVAREAIRKLDLNGKIVIAEFACGACNALDEYSFYHTQGSLMSGAAGKTGVEAEMPEKGIGYLRIYNFDETTLPAVEAVLHELRASDMKVLILDLRDNPGGSLDAAIQVVERFIPAPQPIASTSGKVNKTYQSYSMNVVDVPLLVLVDGNTASAAELVAARLKSRKDTELIGQRTFGKNLVQKLIPVSHAPFGAVRLSWAQFQVPETDDLAKQGGIMPTIPVEGVAAQHATALEKARSFIPMR